ncbi:MAG TPA: hypothetical protein PKH69_00360 [Thiobacillaceae bacterium]|nr:hypothetical protein [Thiobacillaceae bacterium]HNU63434.1 hypothetical protein [Thiobacillaceae bacterium]
MSAKEKIIWEIDLRLFSPEMAKTWSLAMLAIWLVMMLILGIVFIAQGEADVLPDLAGVLLSVTAGLWLLGFLTMALLFHGALRVRYTVSDTGVRMDIIDRVAQTGNRLAIALGLLSGRPGLLGAGLINRSRESEAVEWYDAFHTIQRPKRHLIVFKGAWRCLMFVQCLPDNYARVAARVHAEVSRHGADRRVPGKSPLPAILGRTVLTTLACFPIFALHAEYGLDVFLPLLMFCFALATLWLIPLFGWVVMGSLGLIVLSVAGRLVEEIPSQIRPGETFTRLGVMGSEDWLLLGLACLGMAWLICLSLGALRGRIPSALVAEGGDVGGCRVR